MASIAFLTLGCKLNYAETSTYERGFVNAGWEVVKPSVKADVYLVNTCSVTATSDAKSRNLVRKVHRVNPDAAIIVTGCSAELRRSELSAIEGVTRVFGALEKSLVVPETIEILSCPTRHFPESFGEPMTGHSSTRAEMSCSTRHFPESLSDPMAGLSSARSELFCPTRHFPESIGAEDRTAPAQMPKNDTVFAAYSTGERTRSFLKVQDGCNNCCAYCTVPYARGESRNVPICECVRNAGAIASTGAKEIVLTGVNTGDFGRTTGESFLDLLKALHTVEGIERYRISSIEPNLLTQQIIDWIATDGLKFQPHFHIPLQSGSDEILKAMGRHYDTAFFADRIESVRKAMEHPGGLKVFFGIDLMTGLPGETERHFAETVDFLKQVKPAFIHVFPYSRRPGTPAASMPGQVPEQVKAERVKFLEELCRQFHDDFVAAHRGMPASVLFESKDKDGMMSGYTSNYIRIQRPYDAAQVGNIVEITI